jgi:hypothetical protein
VFSENTKVDKLGFLPKVRFFIPDGKYTVLSLLFSGKIISTIPVHPLRFNSCKRLHPLKSNVALIKETLVNINFSITGNFSATTILDSIIE